MWRQLRLAVAAGAAYLLLGTLSGAAAVAAEPADSEAAQPSESTIRVRVEPVRRLVDYAAVGRLLQGAAGVRRANIVAVDGNSATFELVVRGGDAELAQALAGVGSLSPEAGAARTYRYQPQQP